MCDGQGLAKSDAGPMQNPRWRDLADEEVEVIARFAHETNRQYQALNGEPPAPPWEQAPEWQRDSARKGVRFVLCQKYPTPRLGGRTDPEEQHNNWLEQKLREGWTYGPTKDAEAKTHPCVLPYASLPAWQRRKDLLFRQVVAALDPRAEV